MLATNHNRWYLVTLSYVYAGLLQTHRRIAFRLISYPWLGYYNNYCNAFFKCFFYLLQHLRICIMALKNELSNKEEWMKTGGGRNPLTNFPRSANFTSSLPSKGWMSSLKKICQNVTSTIFEHRCTHSIGYYQTLKSMNTYSVNHGWCIIMV